MYSDDGYLGCPSGARELRSWNDKLNLKVVDQVNETQELVQLNNFAKEVSESQFKSCLQQRISDIASWRWVLNDLTKRLEEAVCALEYEHRALRVVIQRVQDEIEGHSREGSRPGIFCPLSDTVEEAILQEFKFLKEHKKKFEKMIPVLEHEIMALKRTKKRIDADILIKDQTISVEEKCVQVNLNSVRREITKKKKRVRGSPIPRWENRCISLKKSGLRALTNALIAKQQVRGARVYLSIAAQAYAARVDSALRRRLHSNRIKLQDLKWQREEAMRDYRSLDDEMMNTEQNLLETMEQERVIETRLIDRTLRPPGELTRDEVNRKLRDELGRLRSFSKQLRTNIERIASLQNHIMESISRLDSYAEDIYQVVRLDEERIKARIGELPECTCHVASPNMNECSGDLARNTTQEGLTVIKEENEDDYPFAD